METSISIKPKRNKAATCVYKVVKPIYYLKNNDLLELKEGQIFIGGDSWIIVTEMSLAQLSRYVKAGFIQKMKAKEYLAQLNNER